MSLNKRIRQILRCARYSWWWQVDGQGRTHNMCITVPQNPCRRPDLTLLNMFIWGQGNIFKRVRSGLLSGPQGPVDHVLWGPALPIHLPLSRVSSASKNVSSSLIYARTQVIYNIKPEQTIHRNSNPNYTKMDQNRVHDIIKK